jgi:hypothetical protein
VQLLGRVRRGFPKVAVDNLRSWIILRVDDDLLHYTVAKLQTMDPREYDVVLKVKFLILSCVCNVGLPEI